MKFPIYLHRRHICISKIPYNINKARIHKLVCSNNIFDALTKGDGSLMEKDMLMTISRQ